VLTAVRRQVLLELGPAYFKYMNQTANKATALAKLVGFYTVEVRNLESGTTLHKADLVVMENLFFDRKIEKTFDLKGIQGRKVKAKGGAEAPKTLFDEEWREGTSGTETRSFAGGQLMYLPGQQRALTLVCPHSKVVLEESIRNDTDFLAESNIMDYSYVFVVSVRVIRG
jgi:1-phosphatidylinositol-3-phosphate 5-kinase